MRQYASLLDMQNVCNSESSLALAKSMRASKCSLAIPPHETAFLPVAAVRVVQLVGLQPTSISIGPVEHSAFSPVPNPLP